MKSRLARLQRQLAQAAAADDAARMVAAILRSARIAERHSETSFATLPRDDVGHAPAQASCLREMAKLIAHTGDRDSALRYFNEALLAARSIDDQHIRDHECVRVAGALAELHEYESAFEAIEHLDERDWGLRTIAVAQAKRDDVAAAWKTVSQIVSDRARNLTLMFIAGTQASAGRFSDAFETLKLISVPTLYQAVLVDLAIAQARSGDASAAETTSQRITGRSNNHVLAEVATAHARAGRFAQASQTASRIPDPQWQVEALCNLANVQCEAGLNDEARATLGTARSAAFVCEAHERDRALAQIADALARAGEIAAALQTMNIGGHPTANSGDGLAARGGIVSHGTRAQVLTTIAVACANAGDIVAARESFNTAADLLEVGSGESEGWARDKTEQRVVLQMGRQAFTDVALAQVEVGEDEGAGQTAQRIKDLRMRSQAICDIAIKQAGLGRGEQAVATALTIPTDCDVHLPKVAAALTEVGDRENFKQLLPHCANNLSAAYRMSELLAQIYPEQIAAIARAVSGAGGELV